MNATNLERFVEVWQASESAVEVGKKLEMAAEKASNLATKLRNKGVPLKKFKARGLYSADLIGKLTALAEGKPVVLKETPFERRSKALKEAKNEPKQSS